MTLPRAAARPDARRAALPAPMSPLGRLGSWSYRHRRLVAAVWLLILVLVTAAGRSAGSRFKDDLNAGSATQSQQAAAFLQARFPGQAGDVAQVVFRARAPVASAAVRSRIIATLGGLAGLPHVVTVLSPFGPGGASQLSAGGHIAYGVVRFDRTGDAIPDGAIQRVITRA